jgi:hypothetical protein
MPKQPVRFGGEKFLKVFEQTCAEGNLFFMSARFVNIDSQTAMFLSDDQHAKTRMVFHNRRSP